MGRDAGYITADLKVGSTMYMGVCRLPGVDRVHRRLDVRCFSEHQYAFGMLYFTGPKQLSIRMRLRAIELGMTLNECSLFNAQTKEKIPASCERDVFKALEMEYVEPTRR